MCIRDSCPYPPCHPGQAAKPRRSGIHAGAIPRKIQAWIPGLPAVARDDPVESMRLGSPPTQFRQRRPRQRPVGPHPLQRGVRHRDLRQDEEEAVDGVLSQLALRLLVELVALGLRQGHRDLGDQRLEVRILVLEVVAVPRVDIDVERLGMRDDAEVVILVAEDALQPLREFQRLDRRVDADLREQRRDDLAGAAGIGGRRQLQQMCIRDRACAVPACRARCGRPRPASPKSWRSAP